jgi:hypothetical protein
LLVLFGEETLKEQAFSIGSTAVMPRA